jgi:hypothetical protein
MTVTRLINEEFTTLETYASQNLHDKLEELRIIHRAGKCKVSKVAGAIVVILPTGTTDFPVL